MASKKTAEPAVDVAPVLGDIDAFFPLPADPVPGVAGVAVHMNPANTQSDLNRFSAELQHNYSTLTIVFI